MNLIKRILEDLFEEVKDNWSEADLELVMQVGIDYGNLMAEKLLGAEGVDAELKIVLATLDNLESGARAAAIGLINTALGKALDMLSANFKLAQP